MSIFGNIQNASISQSGPKLPDGFDGICEVVKTTVVNGFNGQAFVAEMVVHETNLPAEAPVGYRPSWTANFKHANTAGNILCFLGSACGIDPKTQEQQMRQSITPQMCDFAVSEQQPMRGRFVRVTTEQITTKSDRDFMKHFFGPSPKTFPSRINDANVAPTVAAAPTPAMQSVPVAMPTMPGGFQPPALPGAAPVGLPSMPAAPSAFVPPSVPMAGVPTAAPALPTMPSLPTMPGLAAPPAIPGLPSLGAPPPIPGLAAPPPVPAPVAFPPPGWKAHPSPQAAGWYYLEQNPAIVKSEADLRAGR